jgi:hypothetical protein
MSGQDEYQHWLKEQEDRWEALCGHCGACCGVGEDDPCEHLRGGKKGEYYCSIYTNRFGEHRTVNGKIFNCVPIRQIIHARWPGDVCCGYKREFKKDILNDKGVEA